MCWCFIDNWKYKEFALGLTESEREEINVERRDKNNKE